MIGSVLLAVGLLAATAQAQEEPPGEPTVQQTDPALAEALDRIGQLEARLLEVEARLQAAENLGGEHLVGDALSTLVEGVIVEAHETVQEAVAFGGPVTVHGRIRGPAVSFGGDVRVHQGGLVEGDAVSFGGQILVQDGGSVSGDRVAFGAHTTSAVLPGLENPLGLGRLLARHLVMLLTFAGAGVLVVGLFPSHVDAIAQGLRERPLRAGLLGTLFTGLALVLAVALTLSLLGIPMAVLVMAVLTLTWILGFIGLCQCVGDNLPIQGVGTRRWTAFLLGVLAIASAGYLPVIGQVLLAGLGFFGAGAAIQTRLGTSELA